MKCRKCGEEFEPKPGQALAAEFHLNVASARKIIWGALGSLNMACGYVSRARAAIERLK
jgi:hypothetical protein